MSGASQSRLSAGIASCDIVGHSRVSSHEIQVARVKSINALIREALSKYPDSAVWASGGDGGHLVFLDGDWQRPALELVAKLRRWAISECVPLRVTAHAGEVSTISGADGRTQLVGDGINESGSILAVGTPHGIVVSQQFRREVDKLGDESVRFHDPRPLQTKTQERDLLLMSLPDLPSEWGDYVDDDRQLLTIALERGAAWDALYHAKRLLQVNSIYRDVDMALRTLKPIDYWLQQPGEATGRAINPFLGHLDARSLREVVRLGQLVERRYNEAICRHGDHGDTMFIILKGQVGVYNLGGDASPTPDEPAFVLREGDIVGELSFALDCQRTADLVSLADTALLAFAFDELSPRLASAPAGAEILGGVSRFITSRVLEHVAHAVPFLIGRDRTGPLGTAHEPWESLLDDLLFDCRTLSWTSSDSALSLEAVARSTPASATEGGIHLLVAGTLESLSNPTKTLHGDDFPLLYVDLPSVAIPDHQYVVPSGSAKILQIGPQAIAALPSRTHESVLRDLRHCLGRSYHYDAFMSFNYGDEQTVERWQAQLSNAGLQVYVDTPQPGVRFTSKIEEALMDSLTLLAFISPFTMLKPEDQNWVRKEISFREAQFTNPWIFPVRLRGGDPEQFLLRYTMIDATQSEETAIREAIEAIGRIREGRDDPPMPVSRQVKRHLE